MSSRSRLTYGLAEGQHKSVNQIASGRQGADQNAASKLTFVGRRSAPGTTTTH